MRTYLPYVRVAQPLSTCGEPLGFLRYVLFRSMEEQRSRVDQIDRQVEERKKKAAESEGVSRQTLFPSQGLSESAGTGQMTDGLCGSFSFLFLLFFPLLFFSFLSFELFLSPPALSDLRKKLERERQSEAEG